MLYSCVTETVKGRWWASAIFLVAGIIALLLPLIVPKTTCGASASGQLGAYIEEVCAYEPYSTKDLSYVEETFTSGRRSFDNDQPAINWTPGLLVLMALAIQLPYLVWAHTESWLGVDLVGATRALAMKHPRGQHSTAGCNDTRDVKHVLRALKGGKKNLSSLLFVSRKAATIFVYSVYFLLIQLLPGPFSVDIVSEFSQEHDDPLAYYRFCRIRESRGKTTNIPCVHPVNLILRQLYVVLSLVLIAFILLDVADLVLWVLRLFSTSLQDSSVAACVQEAEELRAKEAASGDADAAGAAPTKPSAGPGCVDPDFATFLGSDGILLLSLVRRATSVTAFESLVLFLWEEFKAFEPPVTATGSGAPPAENEKLIKPGTEGAGEWEKASLTEETETEKTKKQETVVVSDANVDVELAEKV